MTLIYTKVITVAVIKYHFLFVDCCFNVFIWDRLQDITTFEVNVTAYDLENSFIFDNKAKIISHMRFLLYLQTYSSYIVLYLWHIAITKVSDNKND